MTFMTFHNVEVKLASILPGWKTRIFAVVGSVLGLAAAIDPNILSPLLPPKYQPWVPVICLAATYYSHRLSYLHV